MREGAFGKAFSYSDTTFAVYQLTGDKLYYIITSLWK